MAKQRDAAEPVSVFDEDTRVRQWSAVSWAGKLSERWNIGPIPNGGYLLALAGRVLSQALSHQEPLSVTGYFLEPGSAGPVELRPEIVREGKSTSTGAVSLIQQDSEKLRVLASYADLGAMSGPTWVEAQPPAMPPPEACHPIPEKTALQRQLALRFTDETAGWLRRDQERPAEYQAWLAFADGRAPDPLSLLLFSDVLPPPVFNRLGPVGWVPTLELTVHVRARPAPGWLRGRFRSRYLVDGLVEEDGELWDSEDRLVALSRQMARVRERQ